MFSARLAVVLFAVTTGAASKCAPDDPQALDTCNTALEDAQTEIEQLTAQCGPGDITRREGGRLISDDRSVVLSVPPGALPTDAVVKMEAIDAPEVDAPRTSEVLAITLHDADGNEISQLDGPVTLCLKADTSKGGDGCLGFYDEETKTWKCQDECLKQNDDMLCGETDHLTNFAILLTGGEGDDRCGSEYNYLTIRKGGVVASDDDVAFVSVPPAALANDTTFSITPGSPPEADVPRLTEVYTFGPDGLKFNAPATVCIDAANADSKSGCLGYIDESVDPPKWVCEDPCVKHNGKTLCGKTNHFTSFAILLDGGLPDADCAKR